MSWHMDSHLLGFVLFVYSSQPEPQNGVVRAKLCLETEGLSFYGCIHLFLHPDPPQNLTDLVHQMHRSSRSRLLPLILQAVTVKRSHLKLSGLFAVVSRGPCCTVPARFAKGVPGTMEHMDCVGDTGGRKSEKNCTTQSCEQPTKLLQDYARRLHIWGPSTNTIFLDENMNQTNIQHIEGRWGPTGFESRSNKLCATRVFLFLWGWPWKVRLVEHPYRTMVFYRGVQKFSGTTTEKHARCRAGDPVHLSKWAAAVWLTDLK